MSRAMKDSGIPWIGEIPSHWESDNIGSLYSQRNEKVSDKDYPPLSVSKMGVVPQLETAAKTDDGDNRKLVKKGDFAINSRSDRRGSCGISIYDGSVSLINTVLTPRAEMNPRFYDWLFHTSVFADEFYKWGHGIVDDLWTTRWAEMKRISIVVPPIPEQKAIADFLDKKCGEIDEMVSLQEKIIEELKAYKQSVITEAVCKGLNPDVPMKDSGIEWIGQIPNNWETRIGKKLYLANDGGVWGEEPTGNGDTIVLRSTEQDIDGHLIVENPAYRHLSAREIASALLQEGDLIITKSSGSPAHIGKTSLIDANTATLKCCFSNFIQRIRVEGFPAYYWYAFNSYPTKKQFDYLSTTTTGINNINSKTIDNVYFTVPPIQEQQTIANYLDEKCTEIDALISLKQSKIDAWKEYKKSIIYEYITGKKEVTL